LMRSREWLILVLFLTVILLTPAKIQGSTIAPMTPNYELKVFLNPNFVLDSDKKLKTEVLSYFNMPTSVEKIAVQFMDTEDLELNEEGWSVRIRKLESYTDKEFEIVYKKRYPIVNGDITGA